VEVRLDTAVLKKTIAHYQIVCGTDLHIHEDK
jgi:hypothetical protein